MRRPPRVESKIAVGPLRAIDRRSSLLSLFVLAGCREAEVPTPRTKVAPPPPAPSVVEARGTPRPSAPVAAPEPPKNLAKIYVKPFGALSDEDAAFVVTSIGAFYEVAVSILPRSDLPKAAYYPPRRRYRAERLLEALEGEAPEDAFRILGLTAVDISTTKGEYEDWGVLGLGTLDGKTCVISTFRTTKGTRSPAEARVRLGKTAVHEIGHTFGLPHCPEVGCLMEDAAGRVSTTDREYDLCSECRTWLSSHGFRLAPPGTAIPWPRPA